MVVCRDARWGLCAMVLLLSGLGACSGNVVLSDSSGLEPSEGNAVDDGDDGQAADGGDDEGDPPLGDGSEAPADGSGDGTEGGDGDGDVTNPDDGELPGFRLVWRDEFDGPAGTPLDRSRWSPDTGGGGFGNAQLEFDTDRPDNASLDGNGSLAMVAKREQFGGNEFTSARYKTQGLFEFTYGRFEARMRLPIGKGIWPAFWMLGNDIGDVGWPQCGEIDIMENIGDAGRVYGTLHGPGYSGAGGIGKIYDRPDGQNFQDDFHVFAVEWEEAEIRWYVDDVVYQTRTPADLPGEWVYDHPFFIILNLAVGGNFPGNPDGSTQFPQTLLVDYVRVYERL